MSKFNYVERTMSSLSKALSGVVNIQSFPFGNHLNTQKTVIDEELALKNHHSSLNKLTTLFQQAIYNNASPQVDFIPPDTIETPLSYPKLPSYSKFVDYFDAPKQLTPLEKTEVETILREMEKHSAFGAYSFTIRGCKPKGCDYCNGFDAKNSVIEKLLPYNLIFPAPVRVDSFKTKGEENKDNSLEEEEENSSLEEEEEDSSLDEEEEEIYLPLKERLKCKDPHLNEFIPTELKNNNDPYPHVCPNCKSDENGRFYGIRFCSSRVDYETHQFLMHPSEKQTDSQQATQELYTETPVFKTVINHTANKKVSGPPIVFNKGEKRTAGRSKQVLE